MYEEFIFFYSRTDEGNSINYLVNRTQNLKALKDTLMKHPAIPNRIMAEFIIIKEIYDIYFNDYFYREALLSLLDSIISKPETEQNRIYASGVKNYLTRLKTGERPPDFNLLDQNNNLRTLDDFRGKYVYINFCTPDNYSCLKEFPFLNALYKVHDKHLEIVTIMVTEEIHNMKDFMKKNKYSWTSLFYGNDDKLLQNYDVKAYPTSYLIDPEGKMIQSPATLATEGFEEQLFRIMKSRGDL
jgi:thiol-disulfide isomerase/thioredoxin